MKDYQTLKFEQNGASLDINVSCAKIARQVGGQTHHVVFYNL